MKATKVTGIVFLGVFISVLYYSVNKKRRQRKISLLQFVKPHFNFTEKIESIYSETGVMF